MFLRVLRSHATLTFFCVCSHIYWKGSASTRRGCPHVLVVGVTAAPTAAIAAAPAPATSSAVLKFNVATGSGWVLGLGGFGCCLIFKLAACCAAPRWMLNVGAGAQCVLIDVGCSLDASCFASRLLTINLNAPLCIVKSSTLAVLGQNRYVKP